MVSTVRGPSNEMNRDHGGSNRTIKDDRDQTGRLGLMEELDPIKWRGEVYGRHSGW